MNEIVSIDFAEKVETLQALHDMVPAAVEYASEKVGPAGVLAFFDGYKVPQELFLLAA